MKIFTTKSISKLKINLKKDINLIDYSNEDLSSELGLATLERYEINNNTNLEMPVGSSIRELKDKENCVLIDKILPNLKPADATDEALWVTLCILNFKDYVLKRWPDRSKLFTHIFASNWRQRMRDNALGRLWWTMHLSKNLDAKNYNKYLEILLSNSDYRSSLLERSSSANSRVVLKSILKLTNEMEKEGLSYEREKFRSFMKEVDFLGKKTLIHSLDEDNIIGLLKPIFKKCYN